MRDHVQEVEREEFEPRQVEEEPNEPVRLGKVADDEKERYQALVSNMKDALGPRPALRTNDSLTYEEQHAIRYLYEASSGQDLEQGGEYISGLERKHLLNKALAALQPLLSLGMSPDFTEGKSDYIEIRELITRLRHQIDDQILQEDIKRGEPKAKKPESDDDDADDDLLKAAEPESVKSKGKEK